MCETRKIYVVPNSVLHGRLEGPWSSAGGEIYRLGGNLPAIYCFVMLEVRWHML